MMRTSTALRRLGVPVLATMLFAPLAQIAGGGTALANAGATITLSHAPANPNINQSVTETANVSAVSATTVDTVTFTLPAGGSAFFTSGPGNGTRTTSCTINNATAAPAAGSCSVTFTDSVAETVAVNATDSDGSNAAAPDSVTFGNPNGSYTFTGYAADTATPTQNTCVTASGTSTSYGTASPSASGGSPNGGAACQKVSYTKGTGTPVANQGAQTIALTVSGSAYFLPQGSQPVQPAGGNVLTVNGANNKQATCVTGATAGSQACLYKIADTVSEAVTVSASPVANGSTDTSAQTATAPVNFASLQFSGCTTSFQNTQANCATQQAANSTVTYTVTYKEAGAAAAGKSLTFSLAGGGTPAAFPSNQPPGSTLNPGPPATVTCTTDSNGQCKVNVNNPANQAAGSDILTATMNAASVAPYVVSQAVQTINYVANGTPGRVVQSNSIRLTPSTQVDNLNIPGDVVQNTYTVYNCTAGTTSGTNACVANQTLAGQTFTVSVDHGFFTPPCSSTLAPTSYSQCTFDPAAAAGGKAGGLKNLGTTQTVTTAADGTFTVAFAIARDAAFDTSGSLVATLTATQGTASFTESAGTGNSASTISCNTVAQSGNANNTANSGNAGNVQPGCATGTPWTTNSTPLNGASVKLMSVPASSTETALSDSATNNVPDNQSRTVLVQLTDQFGNLTSGAAPGSNTHLSLVKTGVGDLAHCTAWSSTDTCSASDHSATAPGTETPSTDSTGATKVTYTSVRGSYTSAFTSAGAPAVTQDRYLATACPAPVAANTKTCAAPQDGTQTLTATWTAPVTTFATYTAATSASPAVATFNSSTATLTDAVSINWFHQTAQPVVTFSTTPGNTEPAGTVVTVSATVKDQFGNPIQGDFVQFIRSGPQTQNGTSCSATNGGAITNAKGQAGFSFTCTNPSQQIVTIIVNDGPASGNEVARGTQTITFTGTTPPAKRTVHATITCKSPRKHVLRCVVTETPHKAGLSVGFFRKSGSGPIKLGTARTNSNGVAVFRKKNIRSHVKWRVFARVAGSGTTKPATTGAATVTIK